MRQHCYYVYLLTNKNNTVIYTGVTNNLERRILEHKAGLNSGFAAKYNCSKLVHFEEFQWVEEAIAREKQIKGGSRQKKELLINSYNSAWKDLSDGWFSIDDIAATKGNSN